MAKQRVFQIASELDIDKHKLVDKINSLDLGFQVSNYMSMLTDAQCDQLKDAIQSARGDRPQKRKQLEKGVMVRRGRKNRRREVAAEPAAVEEAASKQESEDSGPVRVRTNLPDAPVRRRKSRVSSAGNTVVIRKTKPKRPPLEPETTQTTKAPPAPVEKAPAAPEPPATTASSESAPLEVNEHTEETPVVAPNNAAPSEPATPTNDAPAAPEDKEPEATATAPAKQPNLEPADPPEDKKDDTPVEAPKPSNKGGAKILGHIDINVLQSRLAAEGKQISSPSDRSARGDRGARKTHRTRNSTQDTSEDKDRRGRGGRNTGKSRRGGGGNRRISVVDRDDLYDRQSRGRRGPNRKKAKPAKPQITQAAEHKRIIKVNEAIVLSDLAHQMGVKGNEIITTLFKMGEMMTINQTVDVDTATLIAEQFGYKVENVSFDMSKYYELEDQKDTSDTLDTRPPVVTIMGHVDHGKTSLLDAIRETKVTAGEAGGITQHIGAYQINATDDQLITFLDTPGHEAFTALRARGASVTDIVVLVVAADDGVMPQTVEAINHARDAEVPILVAINKIDKPGANPERVKQALTEYNLIPEEWGGDTLFVEVSALRGDGIDDLIETIILQTEILELVANPNRRAFGVVIESRLDIGLGATASVLVQKGTLHPGDIVVVGEHAGRVRMMIDSRGTHLEEAYPSAPVEITGLDGVPSSGEIFFAVESDKIARDIVSQAQRIKREKALAARIQKPSGLEDLARMMKEGELKELKVIVKADVQGSVEAVVGSLSKLGNEEVRVRVIHSAAGSITENDINLAASSPEGAVIVGFNVRPEARAQALAEERGVELVMSSVIYEIEDTITGVLEGLLTPIQKENVIGHAEIRQTFVVPRVGTIAGCFITDGRMLRNGKCRLLRDGKVITTSRISTLRRFKEDVREVKTGFECGLSIHNYNDIKLGDVVECFEIEEIAAKL